jgi:DNA-binding NtrC family response regulator
LFYRLNVIPLVLPPLRQRRTDVPLLVEHFVRKYAQAGRPTQVSAEALRLLMSYGWPGNVRQLEAVIERALLLSESPLVEPEDLPAAVRAGIGNESSGGVDLDVPDEGLDLEALERALILKALAKAQGNVTRAARLLGLTRRTLQYRLEKLQEAPEAAAAVRNGGDGH